MKPIIATAYMVEGNRITVLPVIRYTPKGVVYLKNGDIETTVRPVYGVKLFANETDARLYIEDRRQANIATLEADLASERKRTVHVDRSHVLEAEAEAKDPGQARRKTDHMIRNLKL